MSIRYLKLLRRLLAIDRRLDALEKRTTTIERAGFGRTARPAGMSAGS